MAVPHFLFYFLNLTNGLGGSLRRGQEAGDLVFNPVKIVKFIRKQALNMNNITRYAVREIVAPLSWQSAC